MIVSNKIQIPTFNVDEITNKLSIAYIRNKELKYSKSDLAVIAVLCQYIVKRGEEKISIIPIPDPDGKLGSFDVLKDNIKKLRTLFVNESYNEESDSIFGSQINLMFRAAHDLCHYWANAGFDLVGEIRALEKMKEFYFLCFNERMPDKIFKILFSEIVGQAAYCLKHGSFPKQKVVDFGELSYVWVNYQTELRKYDTLQYKNRETVYAGTRIL